MKFHFVVHFVASFALAGQFAYGVVFNIDSVRSKTTLSLEIQGVEDTQTSPLRGFIELNLNETAVPVEVTLAKFQIDATETMKFDLEYPFLGNITANVASLSILSPTPVPPPLPGTLLGTRLTFKSVPSAGRGGGDYKATGLPCTLLGSFDRLCVDTFDLDDEDPRIVDQVEGTLERAGDELRLALSYPVVQPLLADSPELGAVVGTANVFCTAVVPIPAPSLAWIDRGATLELSWPKAFENFQVQERGDVQKESWVDSGLIAEPDGDRWRVLIPKPISSSFYRLQKP